MKHAILVAIVLMTTLTVKISFAGESKTSDSTRTPYLSHPVLTPETDEGKNPLRVKFTFLNDVERYLYPYDQAVIEKTGTLLAQGGLDAVGAREEIAKKKEETGELTRDQVAELMANPFSYLWFGMVQNDTYWWSGDALNAIGEKYKVQNTTLIQPVMSLKWSEKWRVIFRPVIPIQSVDTVTGFNFITDAPEQPRITGNFERKTGLGDIVLWTAFSPQYTPPLVYGFGPTIMMNTASDEWLGTGKWSAGPMGTLAYISDKWIVGAVGQHWWSFAGDSDRNYVNLTDIQPIIRYRITKTTNIGSAPNIRYNWQADSGERLSVPIGGGIATVLMLGKLPVGVGVEYYYYAERPDYLGPEHQLRFFFSPVLPSPEWSRVSIFGK